MHQENKTSFIFATDCRNFIGDRPCVHRSLCRCDNYSPMGVRVLIIKLGALGDVVRTACLLPTLKRCYSQVHVTWVSKPSGVRILRGHPLIDKLVAFDAEGILSLSQQRFDLVLSLDKEPGPAALCNAVVCPDKRGIGLSAFGTPQPTDGACESYFQLGLDDDRKFFENRQSYAELVHEALSLPYEREPYRLYFDEADGRRAVEMAAGWRLNEGGPLVGLNTGCGAVFANKAPGREQWVEIARQLHRRGYNVVLLGGPQEARDNAWIAQQAGPGIHNAGGEHSETQFTAVVDQCDVLVAGDTLAMHVAIARDVPVVALFGPTCQQEIDLYDRGVKVISPLDCGPCYRRQCDRSPNCMDAIGPDAIVTAVERACPMLVNHAELVE